MKISQQELDNWIKEIFGRPSEEALAAAEARESNASQYQDENDEEEAAAANSMHPDLEPQIKEGQGDAFSWMEESRLAAMYYVFEEARVWADEKLKHPVISRYIAANRQSEDASLINTAVRIYVMFHSPFDPFEYELRMN